MTTTPTARPDASETTPEAGSLADPAVAAPETQTPDVAAPAAGTAARPGRRLRASRPRPRLLPALLVAALVASLAANGLLAWEHHQQAQVDVARQQALAAGRETALALTTYDSRTLDKDFARIRAEAVPPFADQVAKAASSLRKLIAKYRGNAHGRIVRAGVTSATEDRVQLVFFVDQTVHNSMQQGGRVDRNRIAMTLVRTDAGWKVSEADLL